MLVKPSTPPPEPSQQSGDRVLADSPELPTTPTAATNVSPEKAKEQTVSNKQDFTVPTIQLDTDRISNPMAARLASSLLGHVLFLKGQIPFPVVQMSRMPNMQSNSKAAKKRVELITAIDTLTSHLETTFLALSSAFAQRESVDTSADGVVTTRPSIEKAHMFFVVGPSVGAARAKVALVFDGLEVKLAEKREDPVTWDKPRSEQHSEDDSASEDSESEDAEEEEVLKGDDTEHTNLRETIQEYSVFQDSCESDSEPGPPRSPSPSPSPAPSRPTTPSSTPPRPKLKPRFSSPSPLSTVLGPFRARSMPPPNQTHIEEQNTLRAADRLLSRTLANACAEEDGGMSSELAPTQTHILLRAPRRFTHPSWIPRQNLTKSLESILHSFVANAVVRSHPNFENDPTEMKAKAKVKKSFGVRTEGVWISCRESSTTRMKEEREKSELDEGVTEGESGGSCKAWKEEDEMIWWQWDGKIVGFSDW